MVLLICARDSSSWANFSFLNLPVFLSNQEEDDDDDDEEDDEDDDDEDDDDDEGGDPANK